jgi:hypothetical protein
MTNGEYIMKDISNRKVKREPILMQYEIAKAIENKIPGCEEKGIPAATAWIKKHLGIEVSDSYVRDAARLLEVSEYYRAKSPPSIDDVDIVTQRLNHWEEWVKQQVIDRANARLEAFNRRLNIIEAHYGMEPTPDEDVKIKAKEVPPFTH